MKIADKFASFGLKIIVLFALSVATVLYPQAAPFSISVTVNFIEMNIENVTGGEYTSWWVFDVSPGDTGAMVTSDIVKFINGSNIAMDLFSEVWDDPDSTTIDTLWPIWTTSTVGAVDTFGFRWASYPSLPSAPNISESRVILSTSSIVEADIPAREDRFLYAWLLLPTDGIVGERHRLLSRITISPAITPGI